MLYDLDQFNMIIHSLLLHDSFVVYQKLPGDIFARRNLFCLRPKESKAKGQGLWEELVTQLVSNSRIMAYIAVIANISLT